MSDPHSRASAHDAEADSLRRRVRDLQQAEAALRESEERFRLLAQNVPGTIYLCRNDDRYSMLFLNDAVEQLTGYPKEDFLENRISFVDLFHPESEYLKGLVLLVD